MIVVFLSFSLILLNLNFSTPLSFLRLLVNLLPLCYPLLLSFDLINFVSLHFLFFLDLQSFLQFFHFQQFSLLLAIFLTFFLMKRIFSFSFFLILILPQLLLQRIFLLVQFDLLKHYRLITWKVENVYCVND